MNRVIAARVALTLIVGLLGACAMWAKPKDTIPTEKVAAPGTAKRLVIVLPGYGDSLRSLRNSGIAATIQRTLPDAEVMLVELSIPYYMQGRATQRLHEEVVELAKRSGHREIYLAGASMGGMGVLMYEHDYPNEMRGLILMAPYMGDVAVMKEIEAAGGLANWNAGSAPAQLTRENVPHEEWRVVQSWRGTPRAQSVWLVCGQSDRLRSAAEIIATVLPQQHFFSPEGGHAWKVWNVGAEKVFPLIPRDQ